jgi:hypothetical protein
VVKGIDEANTTLAPNFCEHPFLELLLDFEERKPEEGQGSVAGNHTVLPNFSDRDDFDVGKMAPDCFGESLWSGSEFTNDLEERFFEAGVNVGGALAVREAEN